MRGSAETLTLAVAEFQGQNNTWTGAKPEKNETLGDNPLGPGAENWLNWIHPPHWAICHRGVTHVPPPFPAASLDDFGSNLATGVDTMAYKRECGAYWEHGGTSLNRAGPFLISRTDGPAAECYFYSGPDGIRGEYVFKGRDP